MISSNLIHHLQHTKHLVVLTGAGVSAESGIPTFRDTLTGLWENYDAELLASEEGFMADPALVWGWYEWRRKKVLQATPNRAHRVIAKFSEQVPKLTLITQNVDDVHERAGSQSVLHLHGSLHHPRCFHCHAPYVLPEYIPEAALLLKESRIEPPQCPRCHHLIRPGIVWFGESLPTEQWDAAVHAAQSCDLMLIVGTSGIVYPAAELPYMAEKQGAKIAQVNPCITSLNGIATYNLHGNASEMLSKLQRLTFL